MLNVHNLRVDYDGVTAVRDLDLAVAAGQIYGFVGPNGAGKTSTLKALAGVLDPTYGTIMINDVDLEIYPEEALRQVSFMPDFAPVYEHLQVGEFLEVFAAAYFCPRAQRYNKAREWSDRVRLADKWSTPVKNLSRGMRQRLVLAKTLLPEPKLILLDEPASGLDPVGRVELRNLLKEVAAQGSTVIISSHILSELGDMCTSVGIMEKGRMVVSGTLEEVRHRMGMAHELVVRFCLSREPAAEAFMAVCEKFPVLGVPVKGNAGAWCVPFSGQDEDAANIAAAMAAAHFPVAEFFMRQADMEDIFLKAGARETA